MTGTVAPVVPRRGTLRPLSIGDVRIGPGFWGDRQQLNGDVILDHCREWMERVGWIRNFRREGERRGREFSDADVYKLVEAMCWESARTGRGELESVIAELGDLIAGAQEPDGYLNTRFGHQGLDARYRDLEWGHELYCAGHLIQAGVAGLRTGADEYTGKPYEVGYILARARELTHQRSSAPAIHDDERSATLVPLTLSAACATTFGTSDARACRRPASAARAAAATRASSGRARSASARSADRPSVPITGTITKLTGPVPSVLGSRRSVFTSGT